MQGGDVIAGQAGGQPEGRHLRGVQDLVGVCVADAGDDLLVPQDALDLRPAPGKYPGQRAGREGRIERIRPECRDARNGCRVGDQVYRQALAGARLGEIEAGPVGEPEPERQRSPAGPGRLRRQFSPPPQPACPGQVGDEMQYRPAARFLLRHQVKELAVAPGRRDRPAAQCGQRRIVGLQHGDLRDIAAVDDAAHGTLPQIGCECLYLWKFRHASILPCESGCAALPARDHPRHQRGTTWRPGRPHRAWR